MVTVVMSDKIMSAELFWSRGSSMRERSHIRLMGSLVDKLERILTMVHGVQD
jgi:hypothetical protein